MDATAQMISHPPAPSFRITSVRLIDPATGKDAIGDLAIREGRLVASTDDVHGPVVDGTGLVAMPGLIDVHVHFRDSRQPAGGDRFSPARWLPPAVVHTACLQTPRPCDTRGRGCNAGRPGRRAYSLPCVTAGRKGNALHLAALAAAGAWPLRCGSMVADNAVMPKPFAGTTAQAPRDDHAMDPFTDGRWHYPRLAVARRLGLPIIPLKPRWAAYSADIALARETGCAMHLQHLSCAGSVAAIREARAEGLPVTGEAAPHHLLLTAEQIVEDDGNLRMNPPLGTRADRDALRQAVLDGTIDILATDHAPHAPATKSKATGREPSSSSDSIGHSAPPGRHWDTRRACLCPILWHAGLPARHASSGLHPLPSPQTAALPTSRLSISTPPG